MNSFDRIFALHRLLQSRRAVPLPLQDIQLELDDCSPATAKRLIAQMRNTLNAPIVYDRERGGYRYDTANGMFELPGLWLRADEIAALLILDEVLSAHALGLLADALKPSRQRLEALLQQRHVGIPDWRKRLHLQGAAARAPGPYFATVAGALAERKRLRIDYHARGTDRMDPPGRIVSPQRLTLYRDNWYLDAWCHTRRDLRRFALERIVAAETLDHPAREIPTRQLEQCLGGGYGIFAGAPTATAELRFTAHAARWVAAENWHPEQQDQAHDDGSLTRRLPYHREDELLMDLMRWGPEIEVLGPASLRRKLVQRLERALATYTQQASAPSGVKPPHPRVKKARQAAESAWTSAKLPAGSVNEPDGAYAGHTARKRKQR